MNTGLVNNNQSPTTIRILGGVLIFIGITLVSGIIALIIWVNNEFVKSASTTKLNGTAEGKQIIFLILGAVGAFGLISIVAGFWQLLTGTRNKVLIWLMLGVWIVLMILVWIAQVTF